MTSIDLGDDARSTVVMPDGVAPYDAAPDPDGISSADTLAIAPPGADTEDAAVVPDRATQGMQRALRGLLLHAPQLTLWHVARRQWAESAAFAPPAP